MSAPAWEREYARRGRLWGGSRLDPNTRRVLDEHPRLRGGRWLDAGCGDGKGLVPLLSRLDAGAPAVVALDASRWALVHAASAVHQTHGRPGLARVGWVQGDVVQPPLCAVAFDAVRAVHLIGHLRAHGRERGLKALFGLLRPGGVLVVSEFGVEDFRAGKGVEVEPATLRRGTGIETHYFTHEELVQLVSHAGGTLEAVREERFRVRYGGRDLDRQRWDLVAKATKRPPGHRTRYTGNGMGIPPPSS